MAPFTNRSIPKNKFKNFGFGRVLRAGWFIFAKNFFCKQHNCSAQFRLTMETGRQPN